MADVKLKNIVKKYPNGFVAVKNFNLEIKDKEFIVLVGPSGCGKSTTLRMIAGLEEVSDGELYIGDRLVNNVAPKDRDIAMVFQSYALYPHMTVYKNMAFALELRKTPKDEIDKKVHEAAKILGLEEYLDRKPKALSGGQRQRVALGRAMVRNPSVFLLDEPLSNLDAKLRGQMRVEIASLHHRLESTFIYVTHDQTEAMTTIDVNTGAFVGRRDFSDTIYKTNLEASQAIARQLRLRNLGGIIIVDFIDMDSKEHEQGVLTELRKAVAKDRNRISISEFTSLGLVQITRKRTRESLAHTLCETCPTCGGRGEIKTARTVCYEILREVVREYHQFKDAKEFRILASQSVIDLFLDEESEALALVGDSIQKPITLSVETEYNQEQYDVLVL